MPTTAPHLQTLFQEAVGYHQTGNLTKTEQLYRQVLAHDQKHADSLHLIGVIAYQLGHYDIASEWIGKAIHSADNVSVYYYNLGNIFKDQNRFDKAAEAYKRAITLEPTFID